MRNIVLLSLVGLIMASARPGATTYPPVTFAELVTRADMIFVGEVIDVRPYPLETRDGTIVKTRVIFRIQDPVFGTTAALEVLEFLGGEWGDIGIAVAGMPRFTIGDRRVVFARRDRSINPIVGFTQGLLRIARDGSGVERVLTLDGVPVAGAASIGTRALVPPAAPVVPMRLSDFRAQIARALGARAR
jgi:hypothetical protein